MVRLDSMKLQVDYLPELFDPKSFKSTVKWIAAEIKKIEDSKKIKIESIAVRGVSGTAIGFAVAAKLGCGVSLVRKSDYSHSRFKVEGISRPKFYVIVDDFVATGTTVQTISDYLGRKPVAIILYRAVQDSYKGILKNLTVVHRYDSIVSRDKAKNKILYGR